MQDLELQKKRELVSQYSWSTDNVVNFEEIRTILGVPNTINEYLEGDDLCENLYRMCINAPLRFGYCAFSFYEDNIVIEKVIYTVELNKDLYNPNYQVMRACGNVNFYHVCGEKGLGKCSIKGGVMH